MLGFILFSPTYHRACTNHDEVMLIFELTKPGSRLKLDEPGHTQEIEKILWLMQTSFYEANLALNLFLGETVSDLSRESGNKILADDDRKSQLYRKIEGDFENPFDDNAKIEIGYRADEMYNREQWQTGRIPREFETRQAFIYAKAFLSSLDTFDKFLNVLKAQPNIPEQISSFHQELGVAFPDLKGVRNTVQHMEDRCRGLGNSPKGKEPKPLELKPFKNQFMKADQGALVLDFLVGSRYGNTMADGHYGEVDVSQESMEKLQSIFQNILYCFKWTGFKTFLPSL